MSNFLAMTDLADTAKKEMNESGKPYGFAHGEIKNHAIRVEAFLVNTNTKDNVVQLRWNVDGKRSSKAKVLAL